jgi:hypothetical protein
MSTVERDDESRGYRLAPSSPVERSVAELRFISQRLRLMGPLILLVTLGNIGVLLWGIGRTAPYGSYQESIAVANIVIAMATIAALGFFETLRKRGDAIFQELSDELQWHVGRRTPDYLDDPPTTRPVLEARVMLRTFSAAAELPLVPGRFGGAAYACVSLLIAVLSVSLLGR